MIRLHLEQRRRWRRAGSASKVKWMSHPYREADSGDRFRCPRCRESDAWLDEIALAERTVHECHRCRGLWVSKEVFTDALIETELQNAVFAVEHGHEPRPELEERIRCPVCRLEMARAEFGHLSGVLVDACRHHGVWLDPTELSRIIKYVMERQAGGRESKTAEGVAAKAADWKGYLVASIPKSNFWSLLFLLGQRRR
jgi:Zn-finger nucleic acid-binding protein